MQDREHAKYSPSFAPTLFRCRGAANMLARVPKTPDTPYAIEGTKAHHILDVALRNGIRDAEEAHRDYSLLFEEDLNTQDNMFYFAIQVALDYVYELLDTYTDAQLYCERRVVPPTPSLPGSAAGYGDIMVYIPSRKEVYIVDYKHGAGVAVEAYSEQLLQYAAGFLFEDDAVIDVNNVSTVYTVIVQPRAFHKDGPIREHETVPFAIWEYLEELDAAIAEAEQPDAPLVPGEKQCRFCDAVAVCPAREAQALSVAQLGFKQIRDVSTRALPAPERMDLERLGLIRAHADTLRDWLKKVDERCYTLAREGHHIPGAKLVEAEPRRKYYGDVRTTARRIAAMLGDPKADEAMDAYNALMDKYPILAKLFETKLIALSTAEPLVVEAYKRRVGRGRKKAAAEEARHAFAYLVTKESSGSISLVSESDPRPAINATGNAFSQLGNTVAALIPSPKHDIG